jgi:hypothetical protein
MIPLMPGCTVCYNITVDINELTDDMVEWYNTIGGVVTYDDYYDYKGRKITKPYVAYNNYKRCHYGNNSVRLHFLGKDASAASMFLLKFTDYVFQHNLKEHNELNPYGA